MSKTRLHLLKDSEGDAIQEVFYPAVSQRVTLNNTSNRNSTDFTRMTVGITPDVDCVYALGDSTVVAKSGEDFFIPANTSSVINVREHTRIAGQAYNSGEVGVLFVSELD